MAELTVSYSTALADLVRQEGLHVDGAEVGPYFSLAQVAAAQQALPGVRFELHASRLGLLPWTRGVLEAYLKAMPRSRWISCHISMLSPLEVQLGLRWQKYVLLSNPKKAQAALIQSALKLKQSSSWELILENMPGFPVKRLFFESGPDEIRQVLEATGCGLLLDLGHTRVAAGMRGISPQAYLEQLPLERTRQIHVSGPRLRGGFLYDAHQPLCAEDYDLLEWALARTRPEVVTLEYFREKNALREQVMRLKEILGL